VVTVHDLAFLALPGCFNARFRMVAKRTHRAAARAADAVVVPSLATAQDVRAHWGIAPYVAHHGPGQAPVPDRGAPHHFLYVGDAEPRKNLDRLREAHARYRAAGGELELVIASGGVALQPLHRHAAALVLPSLHEGFGLPALEALHAGTPVLAADIPALREVCGDAARFVDPYDVDAIARGLTELATVPPLREELRRRGTARAAAFSWRASAEAHIRAYEQAIASARL
jgi:glycosyltransferase involved in cell wall biosynthesis